MAIRTAFAVTQKAFAQYWFYMRLKEAVDIAPDAITVEILCNTTQIMEDDDTTFGYMMAAQELEATMIEAQKDSENPVELEDLELVETPPTTPTKEHDRKQPGLINPIQAAEFVCKTNISLNKFINTIHSYEPYGHHTAYETLIEEYYDKLVQIEDYFKDADKDLVVALIDDKTCKMM